MFKDQPDAALISRRLRMQRADLKREVIGLGRGQGCARLADAIEDLPDWLAKADALMVIGWGPKVGNPLAERIYAQIGARHRLRLGELSSRQRAMAAELLREHGRCRRAARVAA